MVDKISISENYYTARSKTIKNILSKLTNEINSWEIMFGFEMSD
jgi:hypothetical protein